MVCSHFLGVSDNILNLLSKIVLNLWVVNQSEDRAAQGGGGRVKSSEEKENGRSYDSQLEIVSREEAVLSLLVQLVYEDVDHIVSPCSCFSSVLDGFPHNIHEKLRNIFLEKIYSQSLCNFWRNH